MARNVSTTETARMLLHEIGPAQVQAYLVERLKAGLNLETRPQIIRAFAKLARMDAFVALRDIATNSEETSWSRSAATAALVQLYLEQGIEQIRDVAVESALEQLADGEQDVRSAAAIALVRLKAKQTVSQLLYVLNADQLGPRATEDVRLFLQGVQALYLDDLIPKVEHLYGRSEEIEALHRRIAPNSRIQVCSLIGSPGLGKTTLAAAYIRESPHQLKFWLSGAAQGDLAELTHEFLRQADLQLPNITHVGYEFRGTHFDWRLMVSTIERLLHGYTALLAVDGYDESRHPNQLSEFVTTLMSHLPKLQCLLTTRQVPEGLAVEVFKLTQFNQTDALEFVRRTMVEQDVAYDPDTARMVVEMAEGVPLLLKLGAFTVGRTGAVRPWQKEDLLDAWLGSAIKQLSRTERRVLEVLAQYDEPFIDVRRGIVAELLRVENIANLEEHIEGLTRAGLLTKRQDGTVAIFHLLVRDYLRSRTDARSVLRINRELANYYTKKGSIVRASRHFVRTEAYNEAITLISDRLFDLINQGHAAEVQNILVDDLESAERTVTGQANLKRWNAIGDVALLLGDLKQATRAFERALSISRANGDIRNESRHLGKIGLVYANLGELEQAIEHYRRALVISRQIGDRDSEGNWLGNLGRAYADLGHVKQAIDYYNQALVISRQLKDRHGEGNWLGNLGRAYADLGHVKQAIDYYDQALVISRQFNDRHSEGNWLNHLGNLLTAQGDYEGARKCFEQALAINLDVLGETGPDTARSLNNLGSLLQVLGDHEEAREYYEQALAINLQMLGETHPDTARSLNNLGYLLQAQGDYNGAKPYYDRALAVNLEVLGGRHPATATSLNNLGALLESKGDYEGARAYYERALTIREEALGELHPSTAQSLNNLGYLMHMQGDYEGARAYYERALTIREETLGELHLATATSLNNLGSLLASQGDYVGARIYYGRALAIVEEVLGGNHPDTARNLENLGSLLTAQGDYEGARRYLEDALAIREVVLGERHPDTASSMNKMGLLLHAQGDTRGAKTYYEQALKIYAVVLGSAHPNTESVRVNLAAVKTVGGG